MNLPIGKSHRKKWNFYFKLDNYIEASIFYILESRQFTNSIRLNQKINLFKWGCVWWGQIKLNGVGYKWDVEALLYKMSQVVVAPSPQVVRNNVSKFIFNNLGIIYLQKSFLMNQISLNTSMRGYCRLSINYLIHLSLLCCWGKHRYQHYGSKICRQYERGNALISLLYPNLLHHFLTIYLVHGDKRKYANIH